MMYLVVLFIAFGACAVLCDPTEHTLDLSKDMDVDLFFKTRFHRYPLNTVMVTARPGKCVTKIVSEEETVWKAGQDQCIQDLWIYERGEMSLMFDLTVVTNKTEREVLYFINIGGSWKRSTYECFHGIIGVLKSHKLAIDDFTTINTRVFEGKSPEEALKEILIKRCMPDREKSEVPIEDEASSKSRAWYCNVCSCCLSALD